MNAITAPLTNQDGMPPSKFFSTRHLPPKERGEWWREVICRQYASIDIVSKITSDFHSETRIFALPSLQLSVINSSAITIKKQPRDTVFKSQDAYFAVLLLSGRYQLEQHGRIADLQPGDITIYSATQMHQVSCPDSFSKLIFSIPRQTLISRFPLSEACTAIRIPGNTGIGAVTSNFLRNWATHIEALRTQDLAQMSEISIDLLSNTLDAIKPGHLKRSNHHTFALSQIKLLIEQNLTHCTLDAALIAQMTGYSIRYINTLFHQEGTSLMRHVLSRRLEHCYQDIQHGGSKNLRISDIAFHWGFNDLSHFSRVFKQRFGLSPSDLKRGIAKRIIG